MSSANNPAKTVSIRGLTQNVRPAHLEEIFSHFGHVEETKIHFIKGHSSGFGIVSFKNHESSLAACKKMNNGTIDGSTVYVDSVENEAKIEELYSVTKQSPINMNHIF